MLEALGVSYFIDLTKQIDLLRSARNPPFVCALLCRSLCVLGFAVLPASRACSLCLGRGGLHHKVSLLLRYTFRWRPYRVECAGSLPTSEVKRRRARLVLGWGTAREDLRVLPALRARSLCLGRGGLHQKVSLVLRYTFRTAAIPRRTHRICTTLIN